MCRSFGQIAGIIGASPLFVIPLGLMVLLRTKWAHAEGLADWQMQVRNVLCVGLRDHRWVSSHTLVTDTVYKCRVTINTGGTGWA